jgi:hypothetical protein
MAPQKPSLPCPFLAALHALHVPGHAVLQHTPSTQLPLAQSLPTLHFLPFAQRVAQPLVGPPQSTSVSPPFFVPLSQFRFPKHASEMVPHVAPSAAHVVLVHPHTPAVPGLPPPHVFGAVQSVFDLQPHWPMALHTNGLVAVSQATPGLGVCDGTPLVQMSFVHTVASTGLSPSSTMLLVPPAPSHTTCWQSPESCALTGVMSGVNAVVHTKFTHAGCWQSSFVPGHSLSCAHSRQVPLPSQ